MHFRLLIPLFILFAGNVYSFENTNKYPIYSFITQTPDSIPVKDTTKKSKKTPFDDPIISNAKDSTIYSFDGSKAYLYGDATVDYQKIQLKAAYIEFNMEKKEVFAKGLPDTSGKIVGRPVFKDGDQTYTMDDIYYNFDSKKAKINGVVTEQDGGFMHSEATKKMDDNTVNISNGKYTSCDQEHPHYYIAITKGKVIPNDKIISGPAYLVIEDVPLPLGIPFGFFPNTRKRASGIILPEYGEESSRGVFLRGGGFYFGLSDYIDLKLTSDIYSFGSWAVHTQSAYRQRYKYSGGFAIDISKNKYEEVVSNAYSIQWHHSQDPKASPTTTFSANLNFQSTNNNKYNAQNLNDYLTTQISSSIAYSKNFVGTPFRLTTGLTHSQNNTTKIVSVNFPRATLSMDKVYPFKKEYSEGTTKWYEKIGFSWNASLDNKVSVHENNLFKKSVLDSMSNGIKHDIPLSTSFNILKYVTVSPNVNYSEYWYLKTIRKNWDPLSKSVVGDTVSGFRRGWQYSTGISMSTRVYGMFNFGKGKAIQAIRHVITPSVSLSYSPDFSDPRYGFYKTYQKDSLGRTAKYSIFEGAINGGPGMGRRGVVAFGLGNNLEMKVRSSKDTLTHTKKIKIFESLNFGASYNLLADSARLSPITFSGNTKLLDKFNINFSGVLNPYALNSTNTNYIDKYEYRETGKLARLTSFDVGIDFQLNSQKSKSEGEGKGLKNMDKPQTLNKEPEFGQAMSTNYSQQQSVDFSIPWNLRFNYSFRYDKPLVEKTVTQTLGFNGDFSVTPKWKIGFSSGYDITNKKLSPTSVNIFRDLHCWEMRLTLIPFGFRKMYSFQINVKSSMLQDLKWSKRDSYYDNL